MMPARYFPVTAEPMRMKAGLSAFGTDFGNGVLDQRFFQVDTEYLRYLEAKAEVPASRHWCSPRHAATHAAALAWLETTLAHEHPRLTVGAESSVGARYAALAARVQEDVVVLHEGADGLGELVMLNVCFPSGWRPEALRAAPFHAIHAPVPAFDGSKLGKVMVEAMVHRGQHVRFVWTVCCDCALDHHPDRGLRVPWSDSSSSGWLRVERQITVPLPQVRAAIFLIRTSLTPFVQLLPSQRVILAEALAVMPAEVATYKGLAQAKTFACRLLQSSGGT
jgi:dimethylamine monooxygenase subunit A